jgi:hypothetical protein
VTSTQHIENLISQGRYLEAQHGAEALIKLGSELRLDQLYALALSKSGAPEEAQQYIEPLYKNHHDDPETAGIMGSIYKAMFRKNQQSSFAAQSRDTYLKNFSVTKNHYTGINAASMSAMMMQSSKSKEIAREIIGLISTEATSFWELATLGEAHLLNKDGEKSVEYYIKARKVVGNDWGKIGSVYDQLWLLNHYLPVQKEILRIFSPPGVVAFVGHMIDHASRATPRFPAGIEKQVKEAIVSHLTMSNAQIGFCSIACGSDILFAEAMTALNRELNIFLPFNVSDFLETSLKFAGEVWIQRFQSLIDKYPVKIITEESYSGYDALFDFQSKIIFGSAVLRSMAQQNRTTLLTVLSETDLKKKIGGTNYSLNRWPFPDKHVNINPDIFLPTEFIVNTILPPSPQTDTLPNRKIWHHVAVDVSEMAPMYIEKIHKEVIRLRSTISLFHTTDISKLLAVYSFESEFAAFDFMNHLQDIIKIFPGAQQPSINLHSGLTIEIDNRLSGDGINTVIELSSFSIRGTRASEHVAALLALQPNKYALEFAGIIVLSNEKKIAVYRVVYKVAMRRD